MTKKPHKILFALEGDALIVANTGAPFSREGVISICNMDLSAKVADEDHRIQDIYAKGEEKLVDDIREKCLNRYRDDINQLTQNVTREEGVGLDYHRRFMWELLQNADDAADLGGDKARLIGTKGLGFKSVLEITEAPEIYSGGFAFHFPDEKNREELRSIPGWKKETKIPVCRLPHNKGRDDAVRKLRADGYITIIRLPLIAGKKDVVEKVKHEFDAFCASSLLFCQHLEVVEIRMDENSRLINVHRQPQADHAEVQTEIVELVDNGECECWQVWRKEQDVDGEKRQKQLSVSVGLRVVKGEVQPCDATPPLHVFFPTADRLHGVRALVHASCDVTDDRKKLRGSQPSKERICGMLKSITKTIISSAHVPANTALHAFGEAKSQENDGDMVEILTNAIGESVRNTAFVPVIGGGRVKPGDVRLWEHGLGDVVDPDKVRNENENLCAREIQVDENSPQILRCLGTKNMTMTIRDHARTLMFCKNEEKHDCLFAWGVAQSIMQDAECVAEECANSLRKAPFWWTSNSPRAIIDDEFPGISLAEKKPENCPDWLFGNVHIVDRDFLRLVRKEKERLKEQRKEQNANWDDALSGKIAPLASRRGYFDHILLPYCEKQSSDDWKANGWEILDLALKWGGRGEKDEPLILKSGNKAEQRAQVIRLPVGKGRWELARVCYAGAAWGGPKAFDKYFKNIKDRFLLSSPRAWKKISMADDKQKRKEILSWLGCSWMPKMVQLDKLHHEQRERGVKSTKGTEMFELDFKFEHFSKILLSEHANEVLHANHAVWLDLVHDEMYGLAKDKKAEYYSYGEKRADSHALCQLREKEWVPCKSRLSGLQLRAPNKTHFHRCGLDGFFPEVTVQNLKDAVKKTLTDLEVKSSVSVEEEDLCDHMVQLEKHASGENSLWDKGKAEIARPIAAVFNAYAKNESSCIPNGVKIPCLRHIPKKGEVIYFAEAGSVRWADEPYFDEMEVRREILKNQELHVFFLFLEEGKKFDLKPLSEHLDMEVVPGGEAPAHASESLRKRYAGYRRGLVEIIKKDLSKKLQITAYERIVAMSRAHVHIVPQIAFRLQSKNQVDINVGFQPDKWHALASALSAIANCDDGHGAKEKLELLLKEDSKAGFLRRLRLHGLPEDALTIIEQSIEEPDPDGDISRSMHTPPPNTAPTPVPNPAQSPQRDVVRARPVASPPLSKPTVEHDYAWPSKVPATHSGGHGEWNKNKQTGDKGENALLERLCAKYGHGSATNMNINEETKEKRNNTGYDIKLVKETGEVFYYECKSSESARWQPVSLTGAQFALAKEFGDRYVLCIISDLEANPTEPKFQFVRNPAAHVIDVRVSHETRYNYFIDLPSENIDTEI